ncbi:rhodoquinone biosynthesis methyltransferase RquA [Oxalobacter vibrioformis]|uniref:Rhodoquinone biosynthesis methyltransferase RquA n=1 Tax=Oxalobacter vibrioformis TaxID=933080 RepID=A0A9E9LXY8_9BURK|nr:rhodoquinone biosynthesis methyltransferase RquA [Oxalobacter vibrioformis]WAW10924.1 rhodoquinone biosynthesis methyltransferase RquA [Oxalobacter vibrioformis]
MNSDKQNQPAATKTALPDFQAPPVPLDTPDYLRKIYWWAYEHPLAVKFWDRGFLINLILLGNYTRLVDAVLDVFPKPITGAMLQISNAYGQLVPRIQQQLGDDAHFDLIDILPVQLEKSRGKLKLPDERIRMFQCDATALQCPDNSYDNVLMFFLPHELPEDKRRQALSEALRVLKPGGKLVLVEFHRPDALHPLRLWQRLVFLLFEPFATDMWRHELTHYFPGDVKYRVISKTTYFGRLYQRLVVTKES